MINFSHVFFFFCTQRDKANTIEREIKLELQKLFEEQQGPVARRQSYQVHAFRTATDGVAGVLNATTMITADSQVTRAIGPILVLAKNTQAAPKDDSFDGDLNGFLDVNEALLAWNSSDINARNVVDDRDFRVSVVEGLERFTNKLRSRAKVNGGSIGLRALVVSGVTNIIQESITFQKFDSGRILITPCFPVIDETDFNVEVYAGPIGNGGVQGRFQSLVVSTAPTNFTAFVGPDNLFLDKTATFNLVRLNPVGPRDVGSLVGGVIVEGRYFFEKCSQFSYFN